MSRQRCDAPLGISRCSNTRLSKRAWERQSSRVVALGPCGCDVVFPSFVPRLQGGCGKAAVPPISDLAVLPPLTREGGEKGFPPSVRDHVALPAAGR
ncbi:hypothetical protein MTO96_018322 [Rhipicephalus appendiculatus]